MAAFIEISSFDLRYEAYRVRDLCREAALLEDIRSRGIEIPLSVMLLDGSPVLLDGFKRYRCARELEIQTVPSDVIAEDAQTGLLQLLQRRPQRRSCALEEAGFVRLLIKEFGMNEAEVAAALGRSRGWVSMRTKMLEEISESVAKEIYRGRFPAYSYTYVLRRFIRMNGIKPDDVEVFVRAVSGRNLTHRQIERLGHAWFEGSAQIRQELQAGNLSWVLGCMERSRVNACSEQERACVVSMERLLGDFGRLEVMSDMASLTGPAFRAQAHLLLTKILARTGSFTEAMRRFHDRCGAKEECPPAAPERDGEAGDCAATRTRSENGACDYSGGRGGALVPAERPD